MYYVYVCIMYACMYVCMYVCTTYVIGLTIEWKVAFFRRLKEIGRTDFRNFIQDVV